MPRRLSVQSLRGAYIALAFLTMTILVVIPLANVFYEAFAKGLGTYWDNLYNDPDTLSAISSRDPCRWPSR